MIIQLLFQCDRRQFVIKILKLNEGSGADSWHHRARVVALQRRGIAHAHSSPPALHQLAQLRRGRWRHPAHSASQAGKSEHYRKCCSVCYTDFDQVQAFFSRIRIDVGSRISVAYLYPGSGAIWTPGSGMGKKSRSGSQIRIWDEHPGSYFRDLLNNFLGLDTKIFLCGCGSGSGIWESLWPWIRNPGWKKFRSWIRDKHPGSATLSWNWRYSFYTGVFVIFFVDK